MHEYLLLSDLGNSRKISAWVIPLARYSSTSYTVMRRPRTQGLPPLLPASIVMMPAYVVYSLYMVASRLSRNLRGYTNNAQILVFWCAKARRMASRT